MGSGSFRVSHITCITNNTYYFVLLLLIKCKQFVVNSQYSGALTYFKSLYIAAQKFYFSKCTTMYLYVYIFFCRMCQGEERKLVVPPEMGYGARGAPPKIPGIFHYSLVIQSICDLGSLLPVSWDGVEGQLNLDEMRNLWSLAKIYNIGIYKRQRLSEVDKNAYFKSYLINN